MTRSPIENQLAAVQRAVTGSQEEVEQLQSTIEKLDGATSPFEYLQGLCRARGMSDNDSRSAITTYVVHGSLTAYDRQLLRGLTAAERDAVLAARYGSDAARVAHIVLTEGPV